MQRKIVKKIYLSILVSIMCACTLGATTFAWVGIFTNSTFDEYEINLNASNLEEYGIEISLTGKPGSFGSTVDSIELKRAILENYGYNMNLVSSDNAVKNAFSNIYIQHSTVKPNDDNTFTTFTNYEDKVVNDGFFTFDLYLSAFRSYEFGIDSNYYMDVYLEGDLIDGVIGTSKIVNSITYPSDFVNDVLHGIQGGTKIYNEVSINTASAARVALLKYNVVEKGKPEAYDLVSEVNSYLIYQDSSNEPIYDSGTNLYSFGGILPDSYNFSTLDWNKKYPHLRKSVPQWALERGDLVYDSNGINQIIDSNNEYEKVGINDMIKIQVFFWFEGWDADCIDAINFKSATLNLNFSSIKE